MDGFQIAVDLGLTAGIILALLTALYVNGRNEALEERMIGLEDQNALFREFFKKLDVKLPVKKVKAKAPKKVKAVAAAA